MRLPISTPHVALTHPTDAAPQVVHGLLDQGARVTVVSEAADARMADLASRGLVTVASEVPGDAEVVLRCPAPAPAPVTRPRGTGRVTLVGGGPGDPGLLTLAGLEAVKSADVLVCDRLAPLGVLDEAPAHAEVIHVGKIPRGDFTPQERINAVLLEHALAGRHVVRLKGGDNFVFGRGGEEWNACVEAGVPVTVVPGVTSSVAAPALAGIPVTHRSLTQGFVVVSGHVGPDDGRSTTDWGALARTGLTIVVLMGVAELPMIAERLVEHGLAPDTPAASVADAGMPSMRVARATLADIAETAAAQGISAPAVTIIGATVDALAQQDALPRFSDGSAPSLTSAKERSA
ncbi:uroporphyrinogen-III C-methyltransferase [Actinomycetota bacterium]